jgi:hypothetical protein
MANTATADPAQAVTAAQMAAAPLVGGAPAVTPQNAAAKTQAPSAKKPAYLDFVIIAIRALPPIPPLSSLPPKIARLVKLGGIVLAGLLFLLFFIFARVGISDILPFMEGFYNSVGLRIYHYGGIGLVFQNTRSELRYDSGVTKLNVTGKIHNSTKKTQEMPDIMAVATGADGKPIQSWQINAPPVRLAPGEDVDFQSSINAPRATVYDVTLSFIERKKDAP